LEDQVGGQQDEGQGGREAGHKSFGKNFNYFFYEEL
jgi:hypothetical protein